MSRDGHDVFERLGPAGLKRALADLLDHTRLVRLANACGLKYPGMRTQSQTRERIVADLVERSGREQATRRTVVRQLEKQAAGPLRAWRQLGAEERARRLADEGFLRANGNLGLHLFLLAAAGDGAEETEQLLRLAQAQPAESAPQKRSRDEARLAKTVAELQKRLLHLESQMLKSREAEKALKREVVQRRAELADSRELAERLQRQLEQLRSDSRARPPAAESAAGADPL
ncbi:MAG TPA: hypothetical protein VJS92_00410, partial [Candidatus Polarisedimenticolaceae bacterium]|nr:hypothetical protein [Candidatus Polarisedimenticolaceae bacterium]